MYFKNKKYFFFSICSNIKSSTLNINYKIFEILFIYEDFYLKHPNPQSEKTTINLYSTLNGLLYYSPQIDDFEQQSVVPKRCTKKK